MEELHWIGLKAVPGIGNVTFRRLLERFETPESVFQRCLPACRVSVASQLPYARPYLNCAWREIAGVECFRLVTFTSADYPKSLFEIPDPPPFLYVQGEVRCHETSVAIVGSRRATAYGIQATTRLAESLAGHGVTMIFGMARGVDTEAHKGALAAGSRTIGVLGCGIDKVVCLKNIGNVLKLAKLAFLRIFEETAQKLNCIFNLSNKYTFRYYSLCTEI